LPTALKLTEALVEQGFDADLTILGNEFDIENTPYATCEGFLDKSKETDLERLRQILSRTHFLIHPAAFECFGVALVEANMFGVPVVASNVTGIPTIVKDNINGTLFPLRGFVERATAFIRAVFDDYGTRYKPLAISSFLEYERRLNWSRSGLIFKHDLEELHRSLL
jgi:glycosyltransferase involved in cell wall biosynthesis